MNDAASPEWNAQRERLRGLIFDRGARARFVSRAVDEGDQLTLWTDREQVRRTGEKLEADLRLRSRRGAARLERMFERTLAGRDLRAVVLELVDSRWFARYGEAADRDDQLSLEEALYRFLCDARIGDPEVRLAEFVEAMVRALLVQPRPAFAVPLLRRHEDSAELCARPGDRSRCLSQRTRSL